MRSINNKFSNNIPKKTVDALNSPIYLSEITHAIFCNVKNLLMGEAPYSRDELIINQKLISDEELGLPANGVFSSKFSEMLKESIDKKN